MYNREDYREALEEREKCDLYSDEWRFCQAKVQSIATAMVAAGNNWMVGESNGLEEKAEEMKKMF